MLKAKVIQSCQFLRRDKPISSKERLFVIHPSARWQGSL